MRIHCAGKRQLGIAAVPSISCVVPRAYSEIWHIFSNALRRASEKAYGICRPIVSGPLCVEVAVEFKSWPLPEFTEPYGNAAPWKSRKTKQRFPIVSHRAWKSQTPRFPHSHRAGGSVSIQNEEKLNAIHTRPRVYGGRNSLAWPLPD